MPSQNFMRVASLLQAQGLLPSRGVLCDHLLGALVPSIDEQEFAGVGRVREWPQAQNKNRNRNLC